MNHPRSRYFLHVFIILFILALSLTGIAEQAKKPQRVQSTDPQIRLKGFEVAPVDLLDEGMGVINRVCQF